MLWKKIRWRPSWWRDQVLKIIFGCFQPIRFESSKISSKTSDLSLQRPNIKLAALPDWRTTRVEIFHLICSKIWAVWAVFLDNYAQNLASKWVVWAVFERFILKNRSKTAQDLNGFWSRNERFLSGFLSKIWAVWAVFPKKTAQTAQTAQICLKSRSNRSYLERFLSGISTRDTKDCSINRIS